MSTVFGRGIWSERTVVQCTRGDLNHTSRSRGHRNIQISFFKYVDASENTFLGRLEHQDRLLLELESEASPAAHWNYETPLAFGSKPQAEMVHVYPEHVIMTLPCTVLSVSPSILLPCAPCDRKHTKYLFQGVDHPWRPCVEVRK